jgi:hypothetical protein
MRCGSQCCAITCSAVVWFVLAAFITTYLRIRPDMARSTRLASTIASKLKADEFWLNGDKRHLYAINPSRLLASGKRPSGPTAQRFVDSFIEMYEDEATKNFISDSVDQADSVITQLWHSLAKSILSLFYTQTDINGYLRRGSMFVFSEEQLKFLLEKANVLKPPIAADFKLGATMIDLGAGDGAPTYKMSKFFDEVHVTETSWAMRNILDNKGFKVLEVESWSSGRPEFYDLVSCLNLLDRCEKPESLLAEIRGATKPGGLLLVALVLPFRPWVEFGSSKSHKPIENLPIVGDAFESQAFSFIEYMESAQSFRLLSWTRVPYLCEGDLAQSVYVLDDGLFLFVKDNVQSKVEEKV